MALGMEARECYVIKQFRHFSQNYHWGQNSYILFPFD